MSSRSRWLLLLVSTPLVLLAAVGGLLGASTPQTGFAQLRLWEEVVGLIRSNYVEPVDVDKVMEGAMRGLADGLDPASAYLTPDEVKALDANAPLPAGDIGLALTRQFYLRVVAVRDGSPAARAGLRSGDYVRAIDATSTREMSAFTGARRLRGAPGSKVSLTIIRSNAAEPRTLDVVREAMTGDAVSGKRLAGGEGYVRVASFGAGAAAAIRQQAEALGKTGGVIIDLRGTADGSPEDGVTAARAFVSRGTLATLAGRNDSKAIAAESGDGAGKMPLVLLVSNGTAGPAEVFAAALSGNHRAELVGEPTAGLAAHQHLVKLPEGRGIWMTYERYLTPGGEPIHVRGLNPDVAVAEPSVEFDQPAPTADPALAKAVERLKTAKKGA